jgi:hypothetical protein
MKVIQVVNVSVALLLIKTVKFLTSDIFNFFWLLEVLEIRAGIQYGILNRSSRLIC